MVGSSSSGSSSSSSSSSSGDGMPTNFSFKFFKQEIVYLYGLYA